MPAVSIIIPTYNREPLLREAVASVLSQTFSDFELIVVDDGSSDGTMAYLQSLADPRLRVLALPHSGNPAAARNAGIRLARGEWIAFLDSDDLWTPDKLARQLERHSREPGYRWSFTDFARIDDAGHPHGMRRPQVLGGSIARDLVSGSAGIALPTVIVSRGLLDEVGGFDESFVTCQDFDLWVRLAMRAPVLAINESLASIRSHAGNERPWNSGILDNLERIYQRIRNEETGPLRNAARTRHAWTLALRSTEERVRGNHRVALRYAFAAFRMVPFAASSYTAVVKAIVATLTPAAAMRAYYRFRTGGS